MSDTRTQPAPTMPDEGSGFYGLPTETPGRLLYIEPEARVIKGLRHVIDLQAPWDPAQGVHDVGEAILRRRDEPEVILSTPRRSEFMVPVGAINHLTIQWDGGEQLSEASKGARAATLALLYQRSSDELRGWVLDDAHFTWPYQAGQPNELTFTRGMIYAQIFPAVPA